MKRLKAIIHELRSRPLGYWFGLDEPFTYEVENGRVYYVTRSQRRELFVFNEVLAWKKLTSSKSVSIAQDDCTRMIDHSGQLASILERELPERWIIGVEE